MTLSTLWGRLRKKNKGDYRQFMFCILFAMLLMSSLLIMVCSPLIQASLPAGGDSGKQVYLICAVAIVGCLVFAVYASGLFLRYKSREIGIFMALGAQKTTLGNALFVELFKMIGMCSAVGIILGAVLAFLIGKVMEILTADVNDSRFAFTLWGVIFSFMCMLVLFLLVCFLARNAMNRTNIMDVINEERKQEPMKSSVSRSYFISGIILAGAGLFVAVILNQITVYSFGIWMGGWTNAFYLLVVLGVYRILVYAVSSRQKGRNPQKYYNNLIRFGMIKFQGASVVKNMLVMTLLIFAALYAISYIPANLDAETELEDDFSYRYLNDADVPGEDEIRKLAAEQGIAIEEYREGSFIRVIGSGTDYDQNDEGKLQEDYYEEYAEYDCTSASEYEKLTGIKLDIPQGGYYQIEGRGAYENIYYKFGDMDKLLIQGEGQLMPMEYLGNTIYHALIITVSNGMGEGSRFVISDEDFEILKEGLPLEKMETQVLFKTEGDLKAGAAFAEKFFKQYVEGMSEDMNRMAYYNPMEEVRRGSDYMDMTGDATVDADNPLKETDWQYNPIMTPLITQQRIMMLANRMLLFGYVFLICFAAVGIIGYTRSQSMGLANAQTFEDIKKLGADKAYRRELMINLVQKVFVLPTAVGIVLTLLYEGIILVTSDRRFTSDDMQMMLILAGIGLLVAAYQYLIFRVSLRKVGSLLQVN